MSADFVLTALTRDPAIARAADEAGVDRIGIDIERLGKELRQSHQPQLRFSDHELEDLAAVRANIRHASLFVRVNPLHAGSAAEIDRAIELGAQVVMLPYFTEAEEAARFIELLGGRARPVLLLETAAAAARIGEIAAIPGVTEIMVGLNDMHLSLGLSHPFQVLISPVMAEVAESIRQAGLRFGFGGVARPADRTLPVDPGLIYAQYALLGATSAWLARAFYRGIGADEIPEAVRQTRERLAYWAAQSRESLLSQRATLAATLREMEGRNR
jgi:2-keto-3-deoxy-L-rhamnonate aldolase RhmA